MPLSCLPGLPISNAASRSGPCPRKQDDGWHEYEDSPNPRRASAHARPFPPPAHDRSLSASLHWGARRAWWPRLSCRGPGPTGPTTLFRGTWNRSGHLFCSAGLSGIPWTSAYLSNASNDTHDERVIASHQLKKFSFYSPPVVFDHPSASPGTALRERSTQYSLDSHEAKERHIVSRLEEKRRRYGADIAEI